MRLAVIFVMFALLDACSSSRSASDPVSRQEGPSPPEVPSAVRARTPPPCGGRPDVTIRHEDLVAVLDDERELMRMARVTPIDDAGAGAHGMLLGGIIPTSAAARWTFRNRDIVLSVNGVVPEVEQMAKIGVAVRGAPEIRARLLRDGAPIEICAQQLGVAP